MRNKLIILVFTLLFSVLSVSAVNELPQSRMRVYKNCTDTTKCYAVEIYMPESLRKTEYEAFVNNAANKPMFAVLYAKTAKPQYKVELSENDELLKAGDTYEKGRRGRLFVIFLPDEFWKKDPSSGEFPKLPQLIFLNYPSIKGDMVFPTAAVETDFGTEFQFDTYSKIFRQKVVMKNKTFECDNDADCTDDVNRISAGYMKGYEENGNQKYDDGFPDYIAERREKLVKWFNELDPGKINFWVEDLNKCPVVVKNEDNQVKVKGCIPDKDWATLAKNLDEPTPDPSLGCDYLRKVKNYLTERKFTIDPAPTSDCDIGIFQALMKYRSGKVNEFVKEKKIGVKDLYPPFKIARIKTNISNEYEDTPNSEFIASPVLINYHTIETLPAKFNILVELLESDIPFEVANNFKKTAVEIANVAVNPSEDTKKVGERDLPNKFDAAILFGSSVEEKEEDVNGVTTKVRKRITRATLDLRTQPFKSTPFLGEQHIRQWTPFFLDMKVSSGKINADTLSLNRIELGTKFDFTKYYRFKKTSVASDPDYINLSLKFVQASDRDFKQLEYKTVAEFQPRLAFLNRIPANTVSTINKVIKAGDDKIPFREVTPDSGYKIMPFVGGEIGKTWFRRRPAEVIEPTQYIRRIYVGFDATFYLSKRVTLNFVDKYYFSFGKEVDKKENYFKGTLDFALRKSSGYSDSFFISFEKGNLPPFNSAPDVNALKMGYRIINPRFSFF